ncbi:putative glycosidase CRH2 [Rhodotorula toruloides]
MHRSALPLLSGISAPFTSLLLTSLCAPSLPGSSLLVAAQAPAGGGGTGASTGTSSGQTCGWASSCPKTAPCCTEYGYCSSGIGCLAGCNPQGSYGKGYCAPVPSCQSSNYTFADTSRIQMNHTAWDGDASKYDFVLDKLDSSNNSLVQNDEMVLTLTQNGGGTRVSTTRSVLYGTIQASIKTVGVPGVVTAFITMSGVKDEIDFEWTTNNTSQVQSNYYWEGDVDNYSHGGKHTANNRASSYLTYGIQWTPSQLDWLVNGKSVRTLKKSDTTNGRYPQTPSRVQFSVWPAGVEGTSQGTIDWAGGLIDWSSPAYTSSNAFTAHVQWVSIDCYSGSDLNLPFVAGNSSSNSTSSRERLRRSEEWPVLWERQSQSVNSYIWGSNDTNGQIGVSGSNAATIINSPFSTGQNMIIKNGDTKGVTAPKSGNGGTGIFGNTAAGNWWAKQSTGVHVGIIIGGCAVALFLLVTICTLWARRNDGRKSRARKEAAILAASRGGPKAGPSGAAAIPLVNKKQNAYTTLDGNDSAFDLPKGGRPSMQHDNSSYYADSISKNSMGNNYRDRIVSPSSSSFRTATPPVPSLPAQYQQHQAYQGGYAGYGGGAPAYPPQQFYPPQPPQYGQGYGQGGPGYGRY